MRRDLNGPQPRQQNSYHGPSKRVIPFSSYNFTQLARALIKISIRYIGILIFHLNMGAKLKYLQPVLLSFMSYQQKIIRYIMYILGWYVLSEVKVGE